MTGKRSSERTCIACRRQRSREELLGLSAPTGILLLGDTDRGRGAYVCISRDCLNSLNQRALSRAFKKTVKIFDPGNAEGGGGPPSLIATAHGLAERRVLETLGLARRSGVLETGIDRVGAKLQTEERSGIAVAATDLAERSLRRMQAVDAEPFLTSAEIGQAVGMGKVGAARINGGRLASRARYWLAVWKETKPTNGREVKHATGLAAGASTDALGASNGGAQHARGA